MENQADAPLRPAPAATGVRSTLFGGRSLGWLVALLFGWQCLLWLASAGLALPWADTPLVMWDEAEYYGGAVRLRVAEDFFGELRDRRYPLPCWPLVGLARAGEVPLSHPVLALANFLTWLMALAGALVWLGRRLGLPVWAGLVPLSFVLGSPASFDFSLALMGDLALAAWCVLLPALWHWAFSPGRAGWVGAALLGAVLGAGLQLKAVALFAGACAVGGGLLWCAHRVWTTPPGGRRRVLGEILGRLAVAAVGLGAVLALLAPRRLPDLVRDYYHANEVLGTWQVYHGVWNGALWLPNVLLEHFPWPGLFALLVLALPWGRLSGSGSRGGSSDPGEGTMRRPGWRSATCRDLLLVVAPTAVAAGYVSLVVVSKPLRPLYFLAPGAILAGWLLLCRFRLAGDWRGAGDPVWQSPRLRGAALLLVALNALATGGWFLGSPALGWAHATVSAAEGRVLQVRPELPRPSLGDTGLRDPYERLRRGAAGKPRPVRVFVPSYGQLLNASLLGFLHLTLEPVGDGPLPAAPNLEFVDASFRHGVYGNPGGLARDFFRAECLIFSARGWAPVLPDDSLLYANLVVQRLAEYDPVFWDGLYPLRVTHDAAGYPVILALRAQPPTAENFLAIVRRIVRLDPHNLWNLPWLAAAHDLAPGEEFRRPIEAMLAPGFTVPYEITDPVSAAQIARLRASWPTVPPELRYPRVLQP